MQDNHKAYLEAVIDLTKGPNGPPTRRQMTEQMGRLESPRNWDKSTLAALMRDGYLRRSGARDSPLIPVRTPEGLELKLLLVELGDRFGS